jgi:hypothetical protein
MKGQGIGKSSQGTRFALLQFAAYGSQDHSTRLSQVIIAAFSGHIVNPETSAQPSELCFGDETVKLVEPDRGGSQIIKGISLPNFPVRDTQKFAQIQHLSWHSLSKY